MKLIIFSVVIISALANKLQRNYLPPPIDSISSDGAEFLTAPSSTIAYKSTRPTYHQVRQHFDRVSTPTFRNFASGSHIPIIRLANQNNGEGSYQFEYETDNSIFHEEEGRQESFGEEPVNVVHGSYSYQSPEGQVITVNYVADGNGFRATGDHLPTSPPIPETIAKAIISNEASRQRVVDNNGAHSNNLEVFDSDGVEVGRPVNGGVDRRYLVPFRKAKEGYKY